MLAERVGSWFTYFSWIIGSFSLVAAAMGIVDHTSRLAPDMLTTSHARGANESKMGAGLVWGLLGVGLIVLVAGFDQPITLLVVAAVVGGLMMFVYPGLLVGINGKILPEPIRTRGASRLGAMNWSILRFGTLSFPTLRDQLGKLSG